MATGGFPEASVWGPGMIPEPGPPGDPGPTGPAPNLTIGTVVSGLTAAVTISGTNPNYQLNFVLPQGNPGQPGQPGQPASIGMGTVTTLNAGQPATATITGTYPSLLLNLGLPRGEQGVPGEGIVGPPNTLTIGSVVGGVTASASLTGTSPNQVLNLVLPQGAPSTVPGPPPNLAIGTVTTLAPGAAATASVTGTTPNYMLNLGLPVAGPKRVLLTRTSNQTVGSWPANISWQAATEVGVAGTWVIGSPTRITVPAGITFARVISQLELTGGGTLGGIVAIEVRKNGTILSPRSFNNATKAALTGAAANCIVTSSYEIPVVAGDYFEIEANQSGIAATGLNFASTWCQVNFS